MAIERNGSVSVEHNIGVTSKHAPLIEIENLKTYFYTKMGIVRAVDGVSFRIPKERVVGIVGESGCGKSVAARSLLGIIPPPGRIAEGSITYYGSGESPIDIARLEHNDERLRGIRGKEIAMIFQEPMSCLSPVHTVGNQIVEALQLYYHDMTKTEARDRAIELLTLVGIPSPDQLIDSYIFELSGGMRQRVLIALALSGAPKLLMADEPTTAIDVTIQAKVLELILELHRQNKMSIMFITHNMGVIAEIAQDVIVMYLGRVAEQGSVLDIFDEPKHPYTQALLQSIPNIDIEPRSRLETIKGGVPDPYSRPAGCPFSNRCGYVIGGTCDENPPPLYTVKGAHKVSCFLYRNGKGEN